MSFFRVRSITTVQRAVGQAVESDSALPFAHAKQHALGRPVETSLAQQLTPLIQGADSAYPYFSMLSTSPLHGQAHFAIGLRNYATEIEPNIYARPENRVRPPVYDAVEDACRWDLPGSAIGVWAQDSVRILFQPITSGRVLAYWEWKLSDHNWLADIAAGSSPTLRVHKIFQLSSNEDDPDRETRFRYDLAGFDPQVAQIDFRTYGATSPGGEWTVAGGHISALTFNRGEWVRIWHYFDFSARQWTVWVRRQDGPTVKVMDALQMSNFSPLAAFFVNPITSQDSGTTGPQDLAIYVRNFAVVRGLASIAEAEALVEAVS